MFTRSEVFDFYNRAAVQRMGIQPWTTTWNAQILALPEVNGSQVELSRSGATNGRFGNRIITPGSRMPDQLPWVGS